MQSEIKPIIEVKGVSKFFGEKTALDNINLSIKKGEFVTIVLSIQFSRNMPYSLI